MKDCYDVREIRASCMGDSLFALVDAEGKGVCHLGYQTCFSQPVTEDP